MFRIATLELIEAITKADCIITILSCKIIFTSLVIHSLELLLITHLERKTLFYTQILNIYMYNFGRNKEQRFST